MITKKVKDDYKKGTRWLQKRYEMRLKKVQNEYKKVQYDYKKVKDDYKFAGPAARVMSQHLSN